MDDSSVGACLPQLGTDGKFSVGLLHLGDQSIDRGKEVLSVSVWTTQDKFL